MARLTLCLVPIYTKGVVGTRQANLAILVLTGLTGHGEWYYEAEDEESGYLHVCD